jgi:hypothetical protein
MTGSAHLVWTTKLPLPRRFASYIARSAALRRSSAVTPSRGDDARPMLAPTRAAGANSNGSETREMIRRATAAASSSVMSGSTMTNSSPPMRHTKSASRTLARRRFECGGEVPDSVNALPACCARSLAGGGGDVNANLRPAGSQSRARYIQAGKCAPSPACGGYWGGGYLHDVHRPFGGAPTHRPQARKCAAERVDLPAGARGRPGSRPDLVQLKRRSGRAAA